MNKTTTLLTLSCAFLAGCQTVTQPPIETVGKVDLPRFMGDWYVIANIPTFIEKGAHNAIETTFTFRAGSFDGTAKRYTPRGFVQDKTSNAVWGMQFLWPIKSDFRIVYLTPDYTQTVIGREKRDYVWIMARTPSIPDAEYAGIVEFLGRQGYDVSQIQKVPQRWPARQGG
jgi:apolipoprotein D and lipocalin family protein